MPQGKGTYGSQVGRPSKKRTSFVNDNNWWDKLKQGVSGLKPYNPQSVVQDMKQREGKSMLTKQKRERTTTDQRSPNLQPTTPPSVLKRVPKPYTGWNEYREGIAQEAPTPSPRQTRPPKKTIPANYHPSGVRMSDAEAFAQEDWNQRKNRNDKGWGG